MDDTKVKETTIIIVSSDGALTTIPSVEIIKNAYICEGLSVKDLADKFHLPLAEVESIVTENKLDVLRAAHIKHGLAQLQSIQLLQAEKLMNMENQFKKMRIIQIEKMLEDYMAYYSKHGHFYKVHPISGEILKDTSGIPLQLRLPNVASEIIQLKESVSLSEGLKHMLGHIDEIINKPKNVEQLDPDTIDMDSFDGMFAKKKQGEE